MQKSSVQRVVEQQGSKGLGISMRQHGTCVSNGSAAAGIAPNEGIAMPDVRTAVREASKRSVRQAERQRKGSHAAVPELLPWPRSMNEIAAEVRDVNIRHTLRAIESQMAAVDAEIDTLITTPVKLIADVATHTLGAGGKRLRPALVILAAQMCGDNVTRANPRVNTCAAAIELIHTTSLLHDDVVDSATVRRGKTAANLLWGNETSILVGDYLFAQVFVTVSQKGFHDLLPPIAHAISQLCAGELLETQTRGLLTMTQEQYCDIIALKTAALTECACRLGSMAMSAPPDQVESLGRYGRETGMAFQIVDDVFDVVASEKRVGKSVGNDIREGDITLPMLRAMQICSEPEKVQLRNIIGNKAVGEEEVSRALEIIRGSDAVAYSLGVASSYIQSAKAHLGNFPDSPAREVLMDIADYVLVRDR